MPIQIDFRGVMLFNCDRATGGTLTNILIPDGEDVGKNWKNDKGKHPDGSEARVHYAGLVLQRTGELQVLHVPLMGAAVEISTSTSGSVTVELGGLPKLQRATFGEETLDPAKAAARVSISGAGHLKEHAELPTGTTGKFIKSSLTHHAAQLTADKATITVTGLKDKLDLADGDKTAIYNYEVRFPSMDDLEHVGRCQDNMTQDDDFKWLYSLVAGWDKSIELDLLVPRVRCAPRYITVFTCFPAVWETDSNAPTGKT